MTDRLDAILAHIDADLDAARGRLCFHHGMRSHARLPGRLAAR